MLLSFSGDKLAGFDSDAIGQQGLSRGRTARAISPSNLCRHRQSLHCSSTGQIPTFSPEYLFVHMQGCRNNLLCWSRSKRKSTRHGVKSNLCLPQYGIFKNIPSATPSFGYSKMDWTLFPYAGTSLMLLHLERHPTPFSIQWSVLNS